MFPDKPVIDPGCGSGSEAIYLLNRGYRVISCDFSPEILCKLREQDSRIEVLRFDLRSGILFEAGAANRDVLITTCW